MADATQLLNWQAGYLSRYFLALVRVMAAMSLNPLFGSSRVPLQARVGLALLVTLTLFPPGDSSSPPVVLGPAQVVGEILIGLLAGFAVTVVLATIQFGAGFIGATSGLTLGSSLDPHADLGSSALDQLFSLLAILVFLQVNGHHLFLAGLRQLFQTVDVGQALLLPTTSDALIAVSAGVFSAGVQMALPVLAALLLADLALGILARVAPQLNLFALGMPVKLAVGLGLVVMALPWMASHMAVLWRGLPVAMAGLAR